MPVNSLDHLERIVERTSLRVVGIQARTNNADEAAGRGRIPGLWKRYYGEMVSDRLPRGVRRDRVYEVYSDYESDHTGAYSVLIGVEVPLDEPAPEGLAAVTIPAASYIVTPAEGEIPQAVQQAWDRVWNHFAMAGTPTRAFSVDFEEYQLDDQQRITGCHLYIAIR